MATRNHDIKPRRETTTQYKNLLYLSIIISTSYKAAKNTTAILKAYYEDGNEKV